MAGEGQEELDHAALRRRLPDPRLVALALDANVFQSSGAQGRAVERLLALNGEGEVDLLLPHAVEAELMDPRTPVEVRRRGERVRGVAPRILTEVERRLLEGVREVLQGQAAPGRHAADAANLVDAYRHAPVFVTNDRRILKRRQSLAEVMPSLKIVSPAELADAYDAWVAADADWRNDV